ncbi:NADP-dependent oxidoreductase [Stackebrandtia nassauensis]|uniref:Alcohol dehydrogenase GroES domain protein n=1 Tax=Stackebrandtia nassauensis (strain DSM 44728 / CIP 108903 / NRRL B-16338 / NBRC 102104 / LLR-40K-21) TaxID=446470 RepID=D3PVF3_STANL|nr:NADP-dependent oxidoreductase [Stackebrandtia nassauensis]ADD43067.1 Alcohol dehydrogenase GroES domain protein [Stackebrandtia nassauensis DSM 44728]
MKALTAVGYGPLADLTFSDVDKPVPGPGQVLVRTEAVALNPLDVKLVLGSVREVFPVTHPFVVGIDVSGTVEAVGPDTIGYAPGDAVTAMNLGVAGAVAEYTLAQTGPLLTHRPEGVDARSAAALPAAGLTALSLLHHCVPVAGRDVLISGATGGVGSFAVQLFAAAGARVLATGRPDDTETVLGWGAHHVIDYTGGKTAQLARELVPGGVDVVLALAEDGAALPGIAAAAIDEGLVLTCTEQPTALERGVTVERVDLTARDGDLSGLAARVSLGELRVPVTGVYPFSEARTAYEDLVGKHTVGKLVVEF